MALLQTGSPDLEFEPEELFIINCLRTEFSGDGIHSFSKAGYTIISWDRVFETALQWNISPLLHRVIKSQSHFLGLTDIPAHVVRDIEAAYIKTYVVNKADFGELLEIVKIFDTAGIRVILLKGSHLAQFVYQDIGLRWMADIDILIRKEDLKKASELLVSMGYEYPDLEPAVWNDFGVKWEVRDRASVIEWLKTDHMHLIYCNPNAIQSLEIHWGIARSASPFIIDTEGLWERAWVEEVDGVRLWVLSPEDLLLHLSLHDSYYHHLNLFGLRPCCDVAAVVRRFSGQIDWAQLQARAREWGIEKYLYIMLRLSRELLGSDIPVDFLQGIGDKMCNDRIISEAERRILGKETDEPAFKGMKYPTKIQTFNPDEGFFKKIGFFLKRIPITREELASRYSLPSSSKRICLYRLVRFASLLFSYARVYVPYFWYRLRHGQLPPADYSLDLWLTSPISKK